MKTDQTALELAVPDKGELATLPAQQISPAALMQAVIEKGISAENVGVLERLIELNERVELRNAEREFNRAFVALQADLPVIVASTIIPNRGKYERFEDVMSKVGPLLVKHGFTVSFTMDFKESRIIETCHLKHVGGHSQSNSFAVRSGRADSDTQADCKAATTAKRNALLNCLNIVIRQDAMQNEEGDASLEGELISDDKIQYLREQVKETGSDEAKFLKFAGVDKYEEIRSGAYDVLVRSLATKARRP